MASLTIIAAVTASASLLVMTNASLLQIAVLHRRVAGETLDIR